MVVHARSVGLLVLLFVAVLPVALAGTGVVCFVLGLTPLCGAVVLPDTARRDGGFEHTSRRGERRLKKERMAGVGLEGWCERVRERDREMERDTA